MFYSFYCNFIQRRRSFPKFTQVQNIRSLHSFLVYLSFIVSSNESKFQETGKWTMVGINNNAFEELDWPTCTIFTKGS